MAFADQLRQTADTIWAAQHEHPFVHGIGDGSLEPSKFRHYICQDYLFLIDYARLLALGCAHAPALADMTRFAQLADAVLGSEMNLHRHYAADWGISPPELEATEPTATTRAYTDFLLRTDARSMSAWNFATARSSSASSGRVIRVPDRLLQFRVIEDVVA